MMLIVAGACLAVLALQPPGFRHVATFDTAVGLLCVVAVVSLLAVPAATVAILCLTTRLLRLFPVLDFALPRPAAREFREARLRLTTISVDALALTSLALILVMPLLSGSPVPVSVLAEPVHAAGYTFVAQSGGLEVPSGWLSFRAGDVLVSSARAQLAPGCWVMYRDAGGLRALRGGSSTTHLARLIRLPACDGAGRSAAEACGPRLNATQGPITHALLLRRARPPTPAGAVAVPACLGEGLAEPPPAGWECVLVPRPALLGSVQLRFPRLAAPAVPFFGLRRRLLAARPPPPRPADALARFARRAGWLDWLAAPQRAAEAAARAAARAAACARGRAAETEAREALRAAAWYRRSDARKAAAAAAEAAVRACADEPDDAES